jgi:predicted acylesterase/phospholipase RssA
MSIKRKKAIVLSGGGAKGAYEAGILRYIIEKWGLSFDIVAGTSAGALNSFMYSSLDPTLTNQTNANKMAQPWSEVNFNDVLKIPFDDYINGKFNSIFDNRQLLNFTNKYFNQEIFNYLTKDSVLEQEPLRNLVKDGELMAFKHEKFWQPMDTLRDKNILESLWQLDAAPWATWKK